MKAARTSGASNDPAMIERYIDSSSEYMAKMLHDEKIYDVIEKMDKGRLQQYARDLFAYTKEKPEEYTRFRGFASKFALGLNLGSILINKTQPYTVGIPILQHELGGSLSEARATLKWAREMAKNPGPQEQAAIAIWDQRGVLRDANTQELFGQGTIEKSGVEFGARYLQRKLEPNKITGKIPTNFPGAVRKLRKAADWSADRGEKIYEGAQRFDLAAGRKAGMNVPLTMGMYSKVEKDNRLISVLAGYKAGLAKGLAGDPLLRYAEGVSESINFNYGHTNRPPAFRGAGAPLGLFTVYPTAAIATHNKLFKEGVSGAIAGNIKKAAPWATAMGLYLSLAGVKGIPGVDLANKTGLGMFKPGWIHDPNGDAWDDIAGDALYYGAASQLTGLNLQSRFSITPSIPINVETGEFEWSNIAAARPFSGVTKGVDRILEDPSGASFYKAGEDILPPAASAPVTSARWAAMGNVGTKYEHPYIDAEGKPAFYKPGYGVLAAKALGFNPLELQKMRDRSEQAAREFRRYKDETRPMRTAVEDHLSRNGLTVGSEKVREFASKHPDSWANTEKAYNQWVANGKTGSIEQYYQMIAAKAQAKSLENARKKHP